jgi:hypothetical protein
MAEESDREQKKEGSAPGTNQDGKWREDARQWYEELKGDEFTIAPWLNFEWTGERMRIRRR